MFKKKFKKGDRVMFLGSYRHNAEKGAMACVKGYEIVDGTTFLNVNWSRLNGLARGQVDGNYEQKNFILSSKFKIGDKFTFTYEHDDKIIGTITDIKKYDNRTTKYYYTKNNGESNWFFENSSMHDESKLIKINWRDEICRRLKN